MEMSIPPLTPDQLTLDSVVVAPQGTLEHPAASVSAAWRIIVVLEGERRIEIMQESSSRSVALKASEALIVPPHHWIAIPGEWEFSMVSWIFHEDTLRCIYRPLGVYGPPSPVEHWHHTTAPPSPTLQHYLAIADTLKDRSDRSHEWRPWCEAVVQACHHETFHERPRPKSKAWHTYQHLRSFLAENYQSPITREDVARHVDMSPNHISKLFQEQGEVKFNDVLTQLRLDHAQHLLRDSSLSIQSVALNCGLGTAHRLIRLYKQHKGCTPGEDRYRQ